MNIPFITVEGPIGVGKTSLSKAIADYYQFHLLKEIVEENPFLGKFYADIEEWSFQTEMFFLCNRYKQLEDIDKKFLQVNKPVVADYHIYKNLIFAKRTLKNEQYDKYLKIYDILTDGMPKPNIIIYLSASLDTLLNRIAKRGREIEHQIDPNYLQQLSEDYDIAMTQWEKENPSIPIIRFNGDSLDFVQNKQDLTYIFNTLNQYLQKGVTIDEFTRKI
ncbi:deoxynucleoside kinase [Metabacillus litoralis]|uniref:deoxynucleoside kinase n=1 Tax=Metabacillus TaxID=2675233 RepID=UPI001C591D16|nr:deoxynucleoside kinase [Metabacillus litoralis]MCM3165127.1 deoxynucleoside kinase [Metabacillus litoralis]MCM3413684.1 deoxynucleoside kinase [Metabacillus litoralis]UGB31029.1 deoxynucleoside kinase [Metabacillus sp. B2-18]